MISFSVNSYQFLSRTNLDNTKLDVIAKSSGTEGFSEFKFEIADTPFNLEFASFVPSRPSIGAFQYVDPEVDVHMARRWPKCIHGEGHVIFNDGTPIISELDEGRYDGLGSVLIGIYHSFSEIVSRSGEIDNLNDQKSQFPGYRRSYGRIQSFDICGVRRPDNSEFYNIAQKGEFLGPGLVSFTIDLNRRNIYELVWSEIIPFPNFTDKNIDLLRIRQIADAKYLHINSNIELEDARRHCESGDVRAAIRSGASAIDASVRYFCKVWGMKFPDERDLNYADRLEKMLQAANMPSYATVDSAGLDNIANLYKARNSMHEGDRYYRDASGKQVRLHHSKQVEPMLAAAEQFLNWLDARA